MFFKNSFLAFSNKEQNDEVPVFDKKTTLNLSNINNTDEMVRKEILKPNLNKSCTNFDRISRSYIQTFNSPVK